MITPQKTTLLTAVVLTSLAGALTIKAGKLGLVDVQQVITSNKAGASFSALNKKADADLSAQAKALSSLQAKVNGGKGSAADKKALAAAQTKYQNSAKSYDAQRQKSFAPLAGIVNTAVATASKAQGYTVVLDKRKAAASGIVVYANSKTTDITAAVQKAVKK